MEKPLEIDAIFFEDFLLLALYFGEALENTLSGQNDQETHMIDIMQNEIWLFGDF